jgi:hypothetical protein
LLRASSSMSNRGGIQLDRSRRATVLNDKYILGEELGRGAYGQARAPPRDAPKSGRQKRRARGGVLRAAPRPEAASRAPRAQLTHASRRCAL